jgi:hypothetical protein
MTFVMASSSDPTTAIGDLQVRQPQQHTIHQGRLTFRDLAPELLEMIFTNCDEADPECESGESMVALIAALRPQRDQYFHALHLFYGKRVYNLRYGFGDMSLKGWGFSMIRKISISIP